MAKLGLRIGLIIIPQIGIAFLILGVLNTVCLYALYLVFQTFGTKSRGDETPVPEGAPFSLSSKFVRYRHWWTTWSLTGSWVSCELLVWWLG